MGIAVLNPSYVLAKEMVKMRWPVIVIPPRTRDKEVKLNRRMGGAEGDTHHVPSRSATMGIAALHPSYGSALSLPL